MTSLIMMSIISFYPKFYVAIMRIYLQYTLENATEHALSALIKDIRRAGFIANSPSVISKSAIDINLEGNCIILRYDSAARGEWRNSPHDPPQSDIFTYRYNKQNLEYQTGAQSCNSSGNRWEKLFDPDEVVVNTLQVKKYLSYTQINITTALKHSPLIQYQEVYYVKNYN